MYIIIDNTSIDICIIHGYNKSYLQKNKKLFQTLHFSAGIYANNGPKIPKSWILNMSEASSEKNKKSKHLSAEFATLNGLTYIRELQDTNPIFP